MLIATWLIAVLIFQSSYTASLSSILAAQQPLPTIARFVDLQKSRLQIGYQSGTFVHDYLTRNLGIVDERLVALDSEVKYEHVLGSGIVSAVLDESPYVDTFLTSYGCQYTTINPSIAYFGGFAFAFKKNSPLTNAFSLAIITLEQNGELQSIKDKWLGSGQCATSALTGNSNISFESFGGLFIILFVLYVLLIVVQSIKLIKNKMDKNSYEKMPKQPGALTTGVQNPTNTNPIFNKT